MNQTKNFARYPAWNSVKICKKRIKEVGKKLNKKIKRTEGSNSLSKKNCKKEHNTKQGSMQEKLQATRQEGMQEKH